MRRSNKLSNAGYTSPAHRGASLPRILLFARPLFTLLVPGLHRCIHASPSTTLPVTFCRYLYLSQVFPAGLYTS